jgi:small subunit ribosomal protein S3e
MKQGVLGIKVKIMKGWDPTGRAGVSHPLPDAVTILEPKEEREIGAPVSESKLAPPPAPVQEVPPQSYQQVAPIDTTAQPEVL